MKLNAKNGVCETHFIKHIQKVGLFIKRTNVYNVILQTSP